MRMVSTRGNRKSLRAVCLGSVHLNPPGSPGQVDSPGSMGAPISGSQLNNGFAMNKTIYLAVSFLLFGILTTGCSTLTSLNGAKLPTAPVDSGQGQYQLSMKTEFGNPKVQRGVVDDSTTVQKVLEDSGAVSKFRSMEIEVLRKVPENGRTLRMQVSYDVKHKRVQPEQNYAIRPGDHVVVRPASSSPLGEFGRIIGIK